MAKRRPATRKTIDPATHARLLAVGPYEYDPGPGCCWSIRFDLVLEAPGLPDFEVWWFAVGPGSVLPAPDDELFALWERYRAAHRGLCAEYRRRLLELMSQREGKYTDRMWRMLRRTPPTERDLRGVVHGARVELNQQRLRGASATTYEAQAEFQVFWDEHGVTFGLRESGGEFVVVGG